MREIKLKRYKFTIYSLYEKSRWDRFVSEHPDGMIYLHSSWLNSLQEEHKNEFIALACENESDNLCGLFPLFMTKGIPFKRKNYLVGCRLSSLPRTPVAGPLATDQDAIKLLIQSAIKYLKKSKGFHLEIKSYQPDLASLNRELFRVEWRNTFIIELPENPDNIIFGNKRNHSRIKWSVNKAKKSGVRIREANSIVDLKSWYSLYLATMREKCIPPRSFRFFSSLWENAHDNNLFRLLLAEIKWNGNYRPIAGAVFLGLGRICLYAFSGSDSNFHHLRGNDFIQWVAITSACEKGFRTFDLGEVATDNSGLIQFKSKWGAKTTPLYRYYYPAIKGNIQNKPDQMYQQKMVQKLIWSKIPLSITKLFGKAIYHYL